MLVLLFSKEDKKYIYRYLCFKILEKTCQGTWYHLRKVTDYFFKKDLTVEKATKLLNARRKNTLGFCDLPYWAKP